MKKKSIALLMAASLCVGGIIGGTVAWLTDTTDEVTNTFTDSGVEITLAETTGGNYKMVPGFTISKDPKVTVESGSEACWLFVKIVESTDPNLRSYIDYTVAEGWTAGDGTDIPSSVYYRKVDASDNDQTFGIIGYTDTKGTEDTSDDEFVANTVLVLDSVTSEMMTAIADEQPTLTFTAYASQYYKANNESFEAKEAWENIQPSNN